MLIAFFICFFAFPNRQDSVGQFSCNTYNRFLRFHPTTETGIIRSHNAVMPYGYPCAFNQHGAYQFVSPECLFSFHHFLSATMGTGDESQIRSKLFFITEAIYVIHFCQQAHCRYHAKSRNSHQSVVGIGITRASGKITYLSC